MYTEFWDTLSLSKRLYNEYLRPICDKFGLTRMELDILLFLANNPEYDTAKEIVEVRRLTKSQVSMSLRSLVQRGYLRKTFHPGNRKTIHLALLPSAKGIIEHGRQVQASFFSLLFEGVSPEKIEEIEHDFQRIAGNLRTRLEEGQLNAD